MKRRRSSAPGRLRPDGRWSPLTLLVVIVFALAGCDLATSTDRPTASGEASAFDSASPAATASSTLPGEPSPAPPAESGEPSTPSPAAGSSDPPTGSSFEPGSASACSGSDENRDFYASMAAAVDWTVYCPVLPGGWFVDDGRYRLAGGGWMQIGYDGPGDARLMLWQGAFCDTGDGCVPDGVEVGPTAFGDRTGAFLAGDDGGWSVVVDRGATRSWLLVVSGLDEDTARTIAADLVAISG